MLKHMNKTMNIDYNDYINLLNSRELFNKEKQELRRQIFQLENEIKFLKEMGEDILIIHKTDGGNPKEIEFKVKDKQAISDLVATTNDMIKKNDFLRDENLSLKSNLYNCTQELEKINKEKQQVDQELKEIKERNIIERFFNRKINNIFKIEIKEE